MEEERTETMQTDEEKSQQTGGAPEADGEAQPKTDDEKLNTEDGEAEKPEGEKQLERKYSSDSFVSSASSKKDNAPSEPVDQQQETSEATMGDAEQAPVQETIKEEDEAQPEQAVPEPSAPEEPKPTECGEPDPEPVPDEPEPANDDSAPPPSEPEPEPQQELESEPEQTPTEPEQPPAPPGEPIEKEELEQKIQDNEELSNQLESTLSNQNAESESYKKLTDENARLQKHHDDMKAKLEDIEGGHMLLLAEVETLRKVNHEQKETVSKLESEIKILKETQGGDENIKDMQDKLIRLSNEQEDKDRTIHSLQGELDQTKEALKDAEARAARNGNSANANPKSKTCIVM